MKKHLIGSLVLWSGLALVGSLAVMTCTPKGGSQPGGDSATSGVPASVEHGKYLVSTTGCNDCHTPWHMGGPNGVEPDMSKMLSGHPAAMKIGAPAKLEMPWLWGGDMTMTAFSGPWGVSFAANLTPDSVTGIGAWTQDVFVSAMRTGKHMGKGRPIMPPMPWESLKNMTDNDLASIFMYLRTIPAISNQVQEPVPGGPSPMAMGGPPSPGGNQGPVVPPYPGAPPPPPPAMPHGKK